MRLPSKKCEIYPACFRVNLVSNCRSGNSDQCAGLLATAESVRSSSNVLGSLILRPRTLAAGRLMFPGGKVDLRMFR